MKINKEKTILTVSLIAILVIGYLIFKEAVALDKIRELEKINRIAENHGFYNPFWEYPIESTFKFIVVKWGLFISFFATIINVLAFKFRIVL